MRIEALKSWPPGYESPVVLLDGKRFSNMVLIAADSHEGWVRYYPYRLSPNGAVSLIDNWPAPTEQAIIHGKVEILQSVAPDCYESWLTELATPAGVHHTHSGS